MKYRSLVLTALLMLGVGVAYGEGQWMTIATLTASDDVKEISVNKKISRVAITCTRASVTIKSVDVVNSEQTYSFNVGNKLNKDQTQQVTVGNLLMCTTLKITDEGAGTYEVRVKD